MCVHSYKGWETHTRRLKSVPRGAEEWAGVAMAAALRYLIPSLCRLSVSGSASAWPEKRLHGSRVVVVRSRNTPKFLQNKLAAMFTLHCSPSASTSGRDDVNEATSNAITPPPQNK